MREELTSWLAQFRSMAAPVNGVPDTHSVDGGRHGTHILFGSMVHGNEVGSLPAVVRVMEELASGSLRFGGRASFFVGNAEAGLANQRFLEADLNRVFTPEPGDTHEGRRAAQLMPLMDSADVFIDFHQTILATREPFYIFPWGWEGYLWVRAMAAASSWVTRPPGAAFSSGTCCADEYVRLQGRPGITVELSEKGFGSGAEERAYRAIRRVLEIADSVAEGSTSLEDEAMREPELTFYQTVHREKFASNDHGLADGWVNFTPVEEGQALHREGAPAMVAPTSGMVLFPKYPPVVDGEYKKPLPGEIYRIVQPVDGHPKDLWSEED